MSLVTVCRIGAGITVDWREILSPEEPKTVDAVDMDEPVR